MSAVLKPKSNLVVCDGNEAAAWAVSLANVDMVAVYPIRRNPRWSNTWPNPSPTGG